jgi:hypothetical protein
MVDLWERLLAHAALIYTVPGKAIRIPFFNDIPVYCNSPFRLADYLLAIDRVMMPYHPYETIMGCLMSYAQVPPEVFDFMGDLFVQVKYLQKQNRVAEVQRNWKSIRGLYISDHIFMGDYQLCRIEFDEHKNQLILPTSGPYMLPNGMLSNHQYTLLGAYRPPPSTLDPVTHHGKPCVVTAYAHSSSPSTFLVSSHVGALTDFSMPAIGLKFPYPAMPYAPAPAAAPIPAPVLVPVPALTHPPTRPRGRPPKRPRTTEDDERKGQSAAPVATVTDEFWKTVFVVDARLLSTTNKLMIRVCPKGQPCTGLCKAFMEAPRCDSMTKMFDDLTSIRFGFLVVRPSESMSLCCHCFEYDAFGMKWVKEPKGEYSPSSSSSSSSSFSVSSSASSSSFYPFGVVQSRTLLQSSPLGPPPAYRPL